MRISTSLRALRDGACATRQHGQVSAIIPDPGLHADFPGIQANLPGSMILRKNPTFHTGMASIFCRNSVAVQSSQGAAEGVDRD